MGSWFVYSTYLPPTQHILLKTNIENWFVELVSANAYFLCPEVGEWAITVTRVCYVLLLCRLGRKHPRGARSSGRAAEASFVKQQAYR